MTCKLQSVIQVSKSPKTADNAMSESDEKPALRVRPQSARGSSGQSFRTYVEDNQLGR